MFVRVHQEEAKKELIDIYGDSIDMELLNKEGILHFNENIINDEIRDSILYKSSIDEKNNFEYMLEDKQYTLQKYQPIHYQLFRDSRLTFLKHYARVQYFKYNKRDSRYYNGKDELGQYSDAEAFR